MRATFNFSKGSHVVKLKNQTGPVACKNSAFICSFHETYNEQKGMSVSALNKNAQFDRRIYKSLNKL